MGDSKTNGHGLPMEFEGNGITSTPPPVGAQLMVDLVNYYQTYVRASPQVRLKITIFRLIPAWAISGPKP